MRKQKRLMFGEIKMAECYSVCVDLVVWIVMWDMVVENRVIFVGITCAEISSQQRGNVQYNMAT